MMICRVVDEREDDSASERVVGLLGGGGGEGVMREYRSEDYT